MDPTVPPPPKPEGKLNLSPEALASSTLSSEHPPTPAAAKDPHCVRGGVHKTPSEDDIPLSIYASKVGTIHAHGSLVEQMHYPAHPPSHPPPGHLNYAKVAKEEMHDVHEHPPPVKLFPGAETGVSAWDKVEHELPSMRDKRHREDLKRHPGPPR